MARLTNVQAVVVNDGVRDILTLLAVDQYGEAWVKEGLDGEWEPVAPPEFSTRAARLTINISGGAGPNARG